jgi:hypothetical protein
LVRARLAADGAKRHDADQVSILVKSIIDRNRGVKDFADALTPWNGRAEPGKPAEQFYVIQESVAEPFGRCRKMKAGVFDNLRQIG